MKRPLKLRPGSLFPERFDKVYDAARAQAGSAERQEFLGVLERMDAAGGLDPDGRADVLFEELDVLERGAARRKARGGLNKVRAGLRDDLAHADLFFRRQKARLDDDFQKVAAARGLDGLDLAADVAVKAVLDRADRDDHIDLVGAV